MSVRLEQIEQSIATNLGTAFLHANPDLPYAINRILLSIGVKDNSYTTVWERLDSLLFNVIYQSTNHQMVVLLDNNKEKRITEAFITDYADRLLALSYAAEKPTAELEEQLYDLSRNGSYAAMRELLARFEPSGIERDMLVRVLEENHQLH